MRALKNLWVYSIAAMLALTLAIPEKAAAQQGVHISFQTFYDELSPYGRWINTPAHGYVWLPDAGRDFQPYASRGHWVMTEYGHTWVSDYDWGWAPFHYGRWYYDDFYGWAWIPGTEWGPAWVDWRSGNGYYGWAPLGPNIQVNVVVKIPLAHWVFVPQRYICSPRIYTYYAPRTRVTNIYYNTVIINNVYRHNNRVYAAGPRRDEVERVTRRRVDVYKLDHTDKPGRYEARNGALRVYNPDVRDNRQNSSRPARVVEAGSSNGGNYSGRPDRNAEDFQRSSPGYQQERRAQSYPADSRTGYSRESRSGSNGEAYPQRPSRTDRTYGAPDNRQQQQESTVNTRQQRQPVQGPTYERPTQRTQESREPATPRQAPARVQPQQQRVERPMPIQREQSTPSVQRAPREQQVQRAERPQRVQPSQERQSSERQQPERSRETRSRSKD
ncbi:DUF6600 domain-containing protein [Pontibacter harenae]|uniref:DUF6600 domain-containing protein n=1 Tax=Pontibacter harenae TaxID=2894083 RepID=UPI001E44209B|nr:DUF6600 domain-containing protein [Pontibacter harenae]MCC9167518.1 hypothetical protein [Pontibacter harenae]